MANCTNENDDLDLTGSFIPSKRTASPAAEAKLEDAQIHEARLQLATLLLGGLPLSGKTCPKCEALPTVSRSNEFLCAHCDEGAIKDTYLRLTSMYKTGFNVPFSTSAPDLNFGNLLGGKSSDNWAKTMNLTENENAGKPQSALTPEMQEVFTTAVCTEKSISPRDLPDADPKMLTQAMADVSMLHNMLMGSTAWNPTQSLMPAPSMAAGAQFASTIQKPPGASKDVLDKIHQIERGLSGVADELSLSLGKESLNDLNSLQNKLEVLNKILEAIERIEKIKRGNEEPAFMRQMAGIPMASTFRMAETASLPGSSLLRTEDVRSHPFASMFPLERSTQP